MAAQFKLSNPIHFLALGFGSGLAPIAPGTFGTLAALPLVAVLLWLPVAVYVVGTALALITGVWICAKASEDIGVHDHSAIVWDEIAGFLVAALPLALGLEFVNLLVDVAILFALFRIFDALKPWPISWLDNNLGGGLGIMVDDVAAGGAAAAVFLMLLLF
ncbi:phosphatidylglycerophosphatase A [Halorhodospira halochloris]|uniref:Phosphatidylglycerophosphatase A n=1 Tax=Halorhodospira halochloris TaxID=1052 RepID=A0A0X8X6A7_HALHR|nr:phosphatidylglycerophosphatase A [Halorhodospira halochloris]MBK1652435.1 phosphatidylglycerophosphatase A [Halorhodospira halochloris]BAU56326.1 phosphatidylglycerophosphatase A [Halorhodospira halochloris]